MSMSWDDLIKQAEEAGLAFEPVPGGQYELECAKADPVLSSNGKPMLKLRFKIVDGPFAGKMQYDQIVITADNPNAMAFFFRKMAAFGLGKDFFASCPPPASGGLARIASVLQGRRVSATIGVREWPANSGQFRNELTAYATSRGPAQGAPQVGGIPGVAAPNVPSPSENVQVATPPVVIQPPVTTATEPEPPQPPTPPTPPEPQPEPATSGTAPKVPF